MVLVLSRQRPHLILFLVLSVLTGVAYYTTTSQPSPIPPWLAQAWAIVLGVTGCMGLAGIAWQRWHLERGMLLERGALMLQSGFVVAYVGLAGRYVPAGEWVLLLVIAAVWAFVNLWEARLLARDLSRLEDATDER